MWILRQLVPCLLTFFFPSPLGYNTMKVIYPTPNETDTYMRELTLAGIIWRQVTIQYSESCFPFLWSKIVVPIPPCRSQISPQGGIPPVWETLA